MKLYKKSVDLDDENINSDDEQPTAFITEKELITKIKNKINQFSNDISDITKSKCEYCGSVLEKDETKCSHCGAIKK